MIEGVVVIVFNFSKILCDATMSPLVSTVLDLSRGEQRGRRRGAIAQRDRNRG
jgi:hypothetical protein